MKSTADAFPEKGKIFDPLFTFCDWHKFIFGCRKQKNRNEEKLVNFELCFASMISIILTH